MRKIVGFSQKTKRAWLDVLLDKLVQTTEEPELRKFLDKQLKNDLPGKESRAKSAGIVLRVWSSIPPDRASLRDRAVAMLPRISGQERIWLHWGMTALAYPFFRDTAEVIGRLLALQDDFTTAQVQSRMLTIWGDRATTKEAVQKLITTLVDWEVLRSTKNKGHFLLTRKVTASIPDLQLWLLEALLGASAADEIEAQQLLRLPESFPFALSVGVADLRRHEWFDIHRQGLDMDMVGLRKVKLQPPQPTKKTKQLQTKPAQPSLFDNQTDEFVSNNEQARAERTAPTRGGLPEERPESVDERRCTEESIKNEVLQSLSDRAIRFLEVRSTIVVPNGPFAAPTIECVKQFRDGHYIGCIALTQAVVEAVIRHIWQVKLKKKSNQGGGFDKCLDDLHKKRFLTKEWKTKLEQLWTDRNMFHHLLPSVDLELQNLEQMARNTLKLLNELEGEFFGFTMESEKVVPDHPEYWTIE